MPALTSVNLSAHLASSPKVQLWSAASSDSLFTMIRALQCRLAWMLCSIRALVCPSERIPMLNEERSYIRPFE